MNDLIEKIAGATNGTHLVPVLLVIENGLISIEPIENLNKRLSTMTTNLTENHTPQPTNPIDLPIKGMKEALVTPDVVVTRTYPGNTHFSLAFKQFCYDLMRDGLSPEDLHNKLAQGQVDFEEKVERVPCLSTLARWDSAGIVRPKKGKGKRKRSNYDQSLQTKVAKYRLTHPKASAASISRRFNISQTSVWRWAKLATKSVRTDPADTAAGAEALSKATDNIVQSVVDNEQALEEQRETLLSFMRDDPTLDVGQLRELFDVPTETLEEWIREAKRGEGTGNASGIYPRDKYTNAERMDLSNRFARRVVGGETYSQASEKVGVSRSVLVRWCKNLKISLKRKSHRGGTPGADLRSTLQFCLGKKPREWSKLGDWLLANSTSKEKTVFARQCTDMAGILQEGDVPSKKLFTACYRHWANAEMVTPGFKP